MMLQDNHASTSRLPLPNHFLIPAANTSSSPRSSNTVDISEMMSDVSEITSTKKTCEIVL